MAEKLVKETGEELSVDVVSTSLGTPLQEPHTFLRATPPLADNIVGVTLGKSEATEGQVKAGKGAATCPNCDRTWGSVMVGTTVPCLCGFEMEVTG